MADGLPNVELHLHLDGAVQAGLIRDIAARNRIDISRIFAAEGAGYARDFGILALRQAVASALRGPQDMARIVTALLETGAENGTVYCEAMVAPDLCAADLPEWSDRLLAMEEAARPFADSGPVLRLVAAASRRRGAEAARRSALWAAETASPFLAGFALEGDERAAPAATFAWAFDCAREAGLGLTVEAGATAGIAGLTEAMQTLRPARIAHAVALAGDPALVEDLAERGMVIDLCPTAEAFYGLCRAGRDHPVGRLFDRRLPITVSTDVPALLDTTIGAEYQALNRAFDWDEGVFATLAETAIAAAFCDPDTKDRIRKRLTRGSPCPTT